MSIIIAHNWYRSHTPSGENIVVTRELELLQQHQIKLHLLERDNDALDKSSLITKLVTCYQMAGTAALRAKLKLELAKFPTAKILHAHNVMPMFSYELFVAAKELGLTTIQTLHNYRLVANASHFYSKNGMRKPQTAEELTMLKRMNPLTRGLLEPFYDRAYRKIWRNNYLAFIDKFICLTKFQKDLMLKFELPEEKIFVKGNFLSDWVSSPEPEPKFEVTPKLNCSQPLHYRLQQGPNGISSPNQEVAKQVPGYAIYVGRLSAEKGILQLCQLWEQLPFPLYVVGTGPLRKSLPKSNHITYFSNIENIQTLKLIATARFLVMNSTGYEVCPLVLIEALASGVPCLVPNFAALPEIITNQKTGLLFEPGNMSSLKQQALQLWEAAPTMKPACRLEYINKYTPEINFRLMQKIYGIE